MVTLGDTKEAKREDLTTLSCRPVPQIYTSRWLLAWWTALLIMLVVHKGILWAGVQHNIWQVHARCKTWWYICLVFWNAGCEKACKKAHRSFGEPNNNLLYPQKFHISSSWIIFIIHMSLAVGRGGRSHLRCQG